MSEIEEIKDRLKKQWRTVQTGGCKIISMGDKCQCHLCLIDKLGSSLEKEEQAHTMSVFDLNMKIAEMGIALEKEKERANKAEGTKDVYIDELEKRVKELEAKLASIKADPSIGKLVVECDCDHDGEFDAGQRHCRKCGEYLF